jgi:aryl-alcohol dehydrogenase-like predicted oxidoreductase
VARRKLPTRHDRAVGRLADRAPTQQDRLESWANFNTEHTWNVLDALYGVAAEVDRSPAQVALN